MKKILLSTFNETAEKNNFEVFSADEVASYYKEGLMKSMNNQLNKAEKDEFVTTIKFLNKAVCIDESGNEVTLYFRKSQVQFDTDKNGDIMKSMTGTYTDTPENRALNRVGKEYAPTDDFEKSLMDIIKGRYVDNAKNRRLHRVGQEYGGRKGGPEADEKGGKKDKKAGGSLSPEKKQKIWDSIRTVDNDDTWDDAIAQQFGEDVLEKLYEEGNEDKMMEKKFEIATKLSSDKIEECLKEVGTNPEDESTYPGASKGNDKGGKAADKKDKKAGSKKEKKTTSSSGNKKDPEASKRAVEAAKKDPKIKDKLVAAAQKLSEDVGWGESEESIRNKFDWWMQALPKNIIEGIIGKE